MDARFERQTAATSGAASGVPVIYQHPLAYLLGLQGIALLRAFAGDYDREFTLARLGEIRALLNSIDDLGAGTLVGAIPTAEGYDGWAEFYDEPGNQLLELEQPVVREILDSLPVGVALDAACGTGRHGEYLAALGHSVIGVDASSGMLKRARSKVPNGEFHQADLQHLPLPDDHVDLVVCGLALMHVPKLEPVFAEFVRVLRRGGHLVISDWRGLIGDVAMPVVKEGADEKVGYMPTWCRLTSDYLAAALPLGLEVRRCEEPRRPYPLIRAADAAPEHAPGEPPNIWAVQPRCPQRPTPPIAGTPPPSSGTSSSP
jgi:ubiquinone/menaquinone biosynthesis C-methylase UbiE